jgi:hypothetical protein
MTHTVSYLAEPDNDKFFDERSGVDVLDREVYGACLDPSGRSLERARMKLDTTCMNLQRREFRRWHEDATDPLVSIQLQSDASPVTGTEVQGMVLDLSFRDGTSRREYLPAMSLHYGFCSKMDKAVCLLWAIYLVAGPEEEVVRWVLGKCRSMTTDGGTELGLSLTPDIVGAFFQNPLRAPGRFDGWHSGP